MPTNKKLAFIMKNRKRKGMQAHRKRKAEENRAALFVTAAIRGVAWRNTLEAWKEAALYIQGCYRKRLAFLHVKRLHWAATVVQCNFRRHQWTRELRRRNEEATRMQRIFRGGWKRGQLAKSAMAKNLVVQTPWAVERLLKQSKEVRATKDREILQMKDSATTQLWYYVVKDKVALWNAPEKFINDNMFVCGWDDCKGGLDDICHERFASQRELDEHRSWKHRWRCSACCQLNQHDSFPVCPKCENTFDGDGGFDIRERMEQRERERGRIKAVARMKKQQAERKKKLAEKREAERRLKEEMREKKERERKKRAERERKKQEKEKRRKLRELRGEDSDLSDSFDSSDLSESTEFEFGYDDPSEMEFALEMEDVDGTGDAGGALQAEQPHLDHAMSADDVLARQDHHEALVSAAECSITPVDGGGLRKFGPGNIVYHGEFKDGKYHGVGTLNFANGDRYVGEWRKGTQYGTGEFVAVDGRKYTGNWVLGRRHGMGTYRSVNGDITQGMWNEGKVHGRAVVKMVSGASYSGEWQNGKYHGTGKFTSANGDVYDGYFNHGKADGRGTLKSANGRVYRGEWVQDQKTGRGTLTDALGNRWLGTFFRGQLVGLATFMSALGTTYRGHFRAGKRWGYGEQLASNGDVYKGEWVRDKFQGEGCYEYNNGDKYVGRWKKGLKSGRGKYIFADQSWVDGCWRLGKLNGNAVMQGVEKGDRYEGYFKHNRRHGHGMKTWPDGSVYKGMWHRGRMGGGNGRMNYSFGHVYVGGWKRNRHHGKGRLDEVTGDSFEGLWRRGKRRRGKHIMITGIEKEVYEGEFIVDDEQNRREGHGTYYYSDYSMYEGDWKAGKREGYGKYYVECGRGVSSEKKNLRNKPLKLVYEGGWCQDLRSGNGILRKDGNIYDGGFAEGVFEGYGEMIYHDGTKYCGMWSKGLKNGKGKEISSNGKSEFSGIWKDGLRVGEGKMQVNAEDGRQIKIKVFGC